MGLLGVGDWPCFLETGRAASPQTTARTLARMGSCLAEIEQEMPRAEAILLEAISRAAEALQFSRMLNYPSEITLAQAILIRSAIAKGEPQKAYQQFRDLQTVIQGSILSGRAQAVFQSLESQFQAIPGVNKSSQE